MNRFIIRKKSARPIGRRALRRRLSPSRRQQHRIIGRLKDDAARQIRKGLEQRLAEAAD